MFPPTLPTKTKCIKTGESLKDIDIPLTIAQNFLNSQSLTKTCGNSNSNLLDHGVTSHLLPLQSTLAKNSTTKRQSMIIWALSWEEDAHSVQIQHRF